jgi:ABC-type phosphate/phosphonate transport system substrate-binding protein
MTAYKQTDFPPRDKIPVLAVRCKIVCLLVLCASTLAWSQKGTSTYAGTFRVGFSSNTFSDVAADDARAAVKVWAETLAREHKLPVETEPRIMDGTEAMAQALRGKLVDAIALPVDEYYRLRDLMDPGIFVGGINEGRMAVEYLLLVHRDSGIQRLEDLRGRSVGCWRNSRMSLAPAWLDTILVQGGFPRATEFCRMTQINKLSKVVLSVFFRQGDACVVTRGGFKNMSELNPQIGLQLRALAISPEMVPSGFGFRRGYDDPLRQKIITELQKIGATPAGAQILTLFKVGSLESRPVSCLDSAFELLALHERVCGK